MITKYPVGSLMSSLRVHGKIRLNCEFVVSSLKRAHWILGDHIIGYFVKETLGFFHKVASGYFVGFFLNVPTIYSKVM